MEQEKKNNMGNGKLFQGLAEAGLVAVAASRANTQRRSARW